jgi:hypothetical protein
VLTVLAEAGGDGVPVEAGQRVPARVHEPRRQPGEHLQEGFRGCCVASRALLPVFFAVVDDWMLLDGTKHFFFEVDGTRLATRAAASRGQGRSNTWVLIWAAFSKMGSQPVLTILWWAQYSVVNKLSEKMRFTLVLYLTEQLIEE